MHTLLLDITVMEYQLVHPEVNFNTATAGHSAVVVDSDCIMFIGGTLEAMYTYTLKPFTPGACDLNDECIIRGSPEISPISWIQCEAACKR